MPPPPPPADADAQRTQLEARLAAALIYCGRTYRRQVDRHLAAHQLSDARALPVMQISRAGNALRQRDLAE
ncbi:MAG TPA: hypothetical protein VFF98_02870, partial [Novosphingobium sp.]|nr:hypothetical protein [Novosphingobium sp.]